MSTDTSLEIMAQNVSNAFNKVDLTAFAALLDTHVRWGGEGEDTSETCQGKEQVLAQFAQLTKVGISGEVIETSIIDNHIILGIKIHTPPHEKNRLRRTKTWMVFTTRAGRIIDIKGFPQKNEAFENLQAATSFNN